MVGDRENRQSKMKVLITGCSGMLGRALAEQLVDRYAVTGMDVRRNQKWNFIEADITQRDETIEKIVNQKPDIVIHAAAYTDVDGCEENPEKAYSVNAQGTETIALACRKACALVCYIITDFVFDGEKKSAYVESDKPNPINIYGKSKLDGEQFIQSILKRFVIVRSSWLFGEGGKNFVDAILEKANNEEELKVVDDQIGSPTYTLDLARAIKTLLTAYNLQLKADICGIYHITNSGSCSRYEFAKEILRLKAMEKVTLNPATSEEVTQPAGRPKMSLLQNQRYQQDTGEKLRPWQEGLKEYLLG